jgi:hypothetical protein
MVDLLTPNVGFVVPEDPNDMKLVDKYLNDNWAKFEIPLGSPKIVTAVPDTDSSYKPGDRVYVSGGSDPNGLYVCLGVDATWGTFWRPISPVWGPWRRPGPVANPNSIILDPSAYRIVDADSPFQYRLSNFGKIQFRGNIQRVTGTWPDVSVTGYYPTYTTNIPECIIPGSIRVPSSLSKVSSPQIQSAPYPMSSSQTIAQSSQVIYDAGQRRWVIRVNTDGIANITKVFFSGAEYDIGDMEI